LAQPAADGGGVASIDDAEDLTRVGVDDGGHPRLDAPPTAGLVAEPPHGTVAVFVDP
jgi:hypothetical protein